MREAKHEVGREARQVALDGPVEGFRLDTVQRRKIGVQQDPLSAQGKDGTLDSVQGHEILFSHGQILGNGRPQVAYAEARYAMRTMKPTSWPVARPARRNEKKRPRGSQKVQSVLASMFSGETPAASSCTR